MELHVAENYYHTLGCCEATCSFHLFIICFLVVIGNSPDVAIPLSYSGYNQPKLIILL